MSIPGLEPTGVSATGVTLASGAKDPNYQVTAVATGTGIATPFSAVVCTNNTYPLNGTWISDGTDSSTGLWDCLTAATGANWPAGDFTFQTTFSMIGLDPTTASITAVVAADNSVGIDLNGNVEVAIQTANSMYFGTSSFIVSSGFQAGTNDLDFVVDNFPAAASPLGLYVLSLTGTANLVAPTLSPLATPTSNTQPTVSGTNAFPGATVTVYINGVATSTTTIASPTGTFSVSLATALAAGTYTVTVVQSSGSNTSPTSNSEPLVIYPNPPSTPTFSNPSSAEELVTASPTVSGTGEAGTTVTVKEGTTTVCTATVNSAGTWTCSPNPTLSAGSNTLTASATDPLGHTSGSTSVTFVIDTTPPVIGAPSTGQELVSSTPTLSGSAAPGTTVTVKSSAGTTLCTAVATAAGTWSCASASLTNGTYKITATEVDASGNTLSSSSVSFTVDATPPVITLPTNGQVLTTSTPTLSGTSGPALTVTVSQGGTTLCTATATATGTWSCAPTTGLADGSHVVTASEIDSAGNTQTSASVTFFTSSSPPTIVVPTNNEVLVTATPGISGNATPASTVTVSAGGTLLCTTVTGGTGVWTCTSVSLSNGTYTATAVETDSQGDHLSSNSVSFTVDTVKPVITSPTNGQSLLNSTPTLTGTAAPGTSVAVDDGTTTLCTALTNASGAWNCTPSSLPNGSYPVTAVETDPAGDQLSSPTVTFTVNTVVPTITVPTSGQVLVTSSPTLSGTAPPGSSVTVTDGSTTICTAVADPSTSSTPGAWTCTASSLPNATYTVTATATEGSGGTTSPSSPVTFGVDTAAPVVTSPTAGQDVATDTPTITGTAAPGSTVTVTSGSTVLCTVSASTSTGAWSCPVPSGDLSDGPQSVSVVDADADGNTSPATTATFFCDTQPPTLSILTGPANPTNQTTAVFTITQADPPQSSGLATPLCSLDSASPSACPIVGSTITLTGVSQGSHVLGVVAIDNAGNESAPATWPWTVTTSPPPTPTITAPTASQALNSHTPTLSGTAGAGNSVTVTTSTGTVLCTTTAGATGSWSCPSAPLPDGSYTISATATDSANNTSAPSASVAFLVDTVAPTASITAGPPATTNSTTATFTVSESDAPPSSGLASPVCSLNSSVIACSITNTSGTGNSLVLTIVLSAVPQGSNTFTFTAVDNAGNSSTPASDTWTVNATAPAAPTITSPTSGQVVTSSTPTVSGTAAAGNTVSVSSNGTVLCTATAASPTGAWSCTPTSPLGEGDQIISATDTNSFGNTSAAATVSVIVNSAPPETFITAEPSANSNSSSATFSFSSNESPVTYQCGLDGAAFTACTNPVTFTGLTDGSHTLQVRAVDSSGTVDPTPASYTWNVDTVAPAAPTFTTPEANASVDTATPVVSGTAEAGSTVTVTQSGFTICTATADANGNWTCTPTVALAQGSNTLSATATDAAGNVGPAATVTFTVDTVAPTITITSGPPSISSSSSATFVFTSNESPVTYFCSLNSDAGVPCSDPATFTNLADGTYTFSVVAVDAAGNASTTPAQETWTLNTSSDVLAITTPGNGADIPTGNPTIGGTAPSGTVSVSVNGTVLCANAVVSNGQWVCPDTSLANGTYSVSVTGIGTDGGSATVTSSFTVVTTPPTATLTAEPPLKSNSSTAEFQFTASEAGCTFECSVNGSTFASCTTPEVLTGLSNGANTFQVKAVDAAGNIGPPTSLYTWQINTTLPSAPLLDSPGNGAFISSITPTFVGTGPAGDLVTVQIAGATVCTATAAADGSWSCTSSSTLAAGTYGVSLTSTDSFGNISPVTNSSFTIETAAPETTIVSGPPSPTSSISATFVFSSNQSDVSYQCSLNDAGAFSPCTNPDTINGLSNGTNTIEVEAVNGAGIADPTPATYTWTVNTGLTGVFAVNQPANGALVNQSEPTFSGTGTAGDTVTIDVDGSVACVATVGTNGTWSCTATTPESDGQYQVSAASVTGGGTQDGQVDLSFGVDTTPPTTVIISGPPLIGATSTGTFEFGSNETGVTYQCSLDGAAAIPCSDPDTVTGLADGTHTLTVAAVDAAGNVDPNPPTYTWVVGTTPTTSSSSSGSSSALSSSGASSGSSSGGSNSISSSSTAGSGSSGTHGATSGSTTSTSSSVSGSTGSTATGSAGSSGTHGASSSGEASISSTGSTSSLSSGSTGSTGSTTGATSGSSGSSGTHGGSSGTVGSSGTHGSTNGASSTGSTSATSNSSGSSGSGSTHGSTSGASGSGSTGSTSSGTPGTVAGGGCHCGISGGSLFDFILPLLGLGLATRRRTHPWR